MLLLKGKGGVSRDWVVIRLSEKGVVEKEKSCCCGGENCLCRKLFLMKGKSGVCRAWVICYSNLLLL